MTSSNDIDMGLVGDLLREKRKRDNLSLRETAEATGISAPTLQRIEAGQLPTIVVLLKLTSWLGVQLDDLRRKTTQPATVEQIEVYLRADPKLDRKAAHAIATIVRELYDGFVKSKKAK